MLKLKVYCKNNIETIKKEKKKKKKRKPEKTYDKKRKV